MHLDAFNYINYPISKVIDLKTNEHELKEFWLTLI